MDHLPSNQKLLDALLQSHAINAEQYSRCKQLTGMTPAKEDWRQFLDQFLLFLGASLLGLGIIFFFAYNWQDLHKFTKFALIASAILACIILTHFKGTNTPSGKAGLLVASLLTGTLLAVYGQTYQTGADPYGLFLGWATLILGWVWLARLQALWMLFILLCNLALIMYWSEFMSALITRNSLFFTGNPLLHRLAGMSDLELNVILIVFNSIVFITWEYILRQSNQKASRWAVRLLVTYIVILVTQIWLKILFSYDFYYYDETSFLKPLGIFTYIIVLASIVFFYKNKGRDLYMLAISYFSFTIGFCTLIGKGIDDIVASFLMLSIIAVGLSSAFAISLKKTAREWRGEHE